MEKKHIGLTDYEVAQRVKEGKVNKDCTVKSKSIKRIICENIFTFFNFINLFFAVLILLVGSFKNMLFMGVVICNTAIGIIQEIRSKRAVDKLSIIVAKKATVIRDGTMQDIDMQDIVIDDLILLRSGNQIPADCIVIDGECTANESLLTGESDLIHKDVDSALFSGSFISAGECVARVVKIGKDCYASQIHSEAKYIKKVKSQIMTALNKILKAVSAMIFPLGAILFFRQVTLSGADIKTAVLNVTAALIGMVPEGLVLLISTVLAVSVIRLSKKHVLVQELYCIETLARVDVLCLDKTGTITTGEMKVEKTVAFGAEFESEIDRVLASFSEFSIDNNATISAIREYANGAEPFGVKRAVAFSSENKWSAVVLESRVSYILGAGEFINKDAYLQALSDIDVGAENFRILSVAKSGTEIEKDELPKDAEFIGLVLISDKIRDDAAETVDYFKKQGVNLKVISGDNPKTAANIAQKTGIENSDRYIDASALVTDEEIADAAEKYTVFGRVTPKQKKKLVEALKEKGHCVAMTGDGVNDVLALKEADCSVAMAAGSEAARNVSQLVLVKNSFSALPSVVAEGRRTINNIQRSASLFLIKTLFSIALAVSFIFITMRYPFEPIQMSLFSAFTIGIPSFVLALEPNCERITGKFLINVVSKALPTAVAVIINIYLAMLAGSLFSLPYREISTSALFLAAFTQIMFIYKISVPLTKLRAALLVFIIFGFGVCVGLFPNLFSIAEPNLRFVIILSVLLLLSALIFISVNFISRKLQNKSFTVKKKRSKEKSDRA